MTTHHSTTVILGAGLCGLSAAYHLEEQGKTGYLILEREQEVGGLARTVTYNGFSFDRAIHVMYPRERYVSDLMCGKLLKGNTRKQTRQSYCYTAGVYTEYPYQMNNYGLPPAVIMENILGLIEARYESSRHGPPSHFEAWIYQTFGRGIAEHFMVPYNRRQWAWNLKEMNYDWVAERVPTLEIREALLGALQPPTKRYGPNQEFWYPVEGGIQALANALLSYIPQERLWLKAAVAGVDGQRCEIFLRDGRTVRYGHLISTIPLPALVNLLGETVPPAIRQCTGELKHTTVHVVNIGLDGAELAGIESMHWIFFPEEGTIFHRLNLPGNLSPWMVPRGCSSIQTEISESVHRPCERARLIRQSLEGLVRVGILRAAETRPAADGGRVRVAEMVTLDPAYVICDLKHSENTRTIREYLSGLNISTRGRFGEWGYLNMDDAILSGKAVAEEATK